MSKLQELLDSANNIGIMEGNTVVDFNDNDKVVFTGESYKQALSWFNSHQYGSLVDSKKVVISLHYNSFGIAIVMIRPIENGAIDFLKGIQSGKNFKQTVSQYTELGYDIETRVNKTRKINKGVANYAAAMDNNF